MTLNYCCSISEITNCLFIGPKPNLKSVERGYRMISDRKLKLADHSSTPYQINYNFVQAEQSKSHHSAIINTNGSGAVDRKWVKSCAMENTHTPARSDYPILSVQTNQTTLLAVWQLISLARLIPKWWGMSSHSPPHSHFVRCTSRQTRWMTRVAIFCVLCIPKSIKIADDNWFGCITV